MPVEKPCAGLIPIWTGSENPPWTDGEIREMIEDDVEVAKHENGLKALKVTSYELGTTPVRDELGNALLDEDGAPIFEHAIFWEGVAELED